MTRIIARIFAVLICSTALFCPAAVLYPGFALADGTGAADSSDTADSSKATEFTPKVVAVFKNGLGFFIRSGEAQFDDGWAVTNFVPDALMGTFWMSTAATGRYVEEIVAYHEPIEDHPKCRTIEELLRENIGKRVRITRQGRKVEGELLYIGEGDADAAVQIASRFGEVMVFPRNQIETIEFVGDYSSERKSTHKEKRIKFKLSGDGASAQVNMAYLSKGITWVPSYLVNIEEDGKARITFKSVLVNDSEDLEDVDVVFVVGYPNFAFSDQISPMSLQASVDHLVAGLRERGFRYAGRSPMLGQSLGGYAVEAEDAFLEIPIDAGYDAAVAVPGQAEGDLFLYSKQAVTVKKGERAAYTIFHDVVDYEHVYEWVVKDTSGVDPYGKEQRNDDKAVNAVWHSLRLTNSTDYPWTTATALTVSGDKPLAQDVLNYTPKGGKRNLKLTVATDVLADKREDETAREHDIRINKQDYDLVTVEGELSVINYKSEDIKLTVKKNLTGQVLEASDDAETRKTTQNLTGVNPRSLIEWEIELGAGKTTKLTYSYQVYVKT